MNADVLKQVVIGAAGAVVAAILLTILTSVSGEGLIRMLGGLTEEDLRDSDAINQIYSYLQSTALEVPADTVISRTSIGCPEGWEPFHAGAGRFIIGVGAATDIRDETRKFVEGETGGEYQHVLSSEEMPSHAHKQVWGQNVKWGGREFRSEKIDGHNILPNPTTYAMRMIQDTESAGSGKQHNNLPPFIALQFCIRSPATDGQG